MRAVICAGLLIAVALGGCGSDADPVERAGGDGQALTLRIDTPTDGSSTERAEVVVSGAVTPGAKLTVDGRAAELTTAGGLATFRATVELERGENEIPVVASLDGETAREVVRVTRTERGADTDPDDEQGGSQGSGTDEDDQAGASGGSGTRPEDEQGGSGGGTGADDEQGGSPSLTPDDQQGGAQATPTPTATDPDDEQGGPSAAPTASGGPQDRIATPVPTEP